MSEDRDREYYAMMLNSISGIEDDLGANQAPQRAIDLIRQVHEICSKDYRDRFSDADRPIEGSG